MHLEIRLTKLAPETVDSAVVSKLYDLYHNRQPGDTFDLLGYIKTGAVFRNVEVELETAFQDLEIEPDDYYITFDDSEVESVLKTALNKAEGENITTQEAGGTNLGTIFKNNTDIETFEEMHYFSYTGGSFEGCSNLRTVDVGNKDISPLRFTGCTNLEKINGSSANPGTITVPEGTELIAGNTFGGCSKISVVYLPNTLKSLGYRCFASTSLTEIHFGSGITRIENLVFSSVPNLTKIYIKDLNGWLNVDAPGAVTSNYHLYLESNGTSTEITNIDFTGKTVINNNVLYGASYITGVTLPTNVTSVGDYAFFNCSNLVIPQLLLPSLISVGSNSFRGTKIQAITDLGTITAIPVLCFNDCKQLTSVNISQTSVTTIDSNAFANCTSLRSVSLPSTCTTINASAFKECTSLSSIDVSNVTYLGNESLRHTAITSVTLSNNLTYLGSSALANTKITSLVIPDVITVIPESLCLGCQQLQSVTLPNTVTAINSECFRYCIALNSLTVLAANPPALGVNALGNVSNCNIHVPAGNDPVTGDSYVDIYKAAPGWSEYESKISAITT